MAKAKALSAKKKKKKEESTARAVAVEPKYSKAARRFYNENFRDPPQRLSKVLAAAGGNGAELSGLTDFFYLKLCYKYPS